MGDISPQLSREIVSKFSWINPDDLNEEVLFFNPASKAMYSGIIHELQAFFDLRGEQCEVLFQDLPDNRFDWQITFQYRPLQEEVVDAAYEARYGFVSAPPGVGKTMLMAGLICKIGLPTVILVPNERPFKQAYDTLRTHTTIGNVGRVGQGFKEVGDVTVMLINSLNNEVLDNPDGPVAQAFKNAQVLLVDEAHHVASDMHINAIETLGDVKFVLGFTATARRDDDRHGWLMALIGSVVAKITRAQAIDYRLSVPCSFFIEDMPAKKFGFVKNGKNVSNNTRIKGKTPYEIVYEDYVMRNQVRNLTGVNFCKQARDDAGLSSVISVRRLEHIEHLQRLDPSIVGLHGNSPERDEVFERLQSREIMCLATTLMDEATNVPSLSCVAMLAGGKSSVKLEQRIRCDRVFEGMTVSGYFAKDRGYVFMPYDHADFLSSHARKNLDLIKEICSEHPDHELFVNGQKVFCAPKKQVLRSA